MKPRLLRVGLVRLVRQEHSCHQADHACDARHHQHDTQCCKRRTVARGAEACQARESTRTASAHRSAVATCAMLRDHITVDVTAALARLAVHTRQCDNGGVLQRTIHKQRVRHPVPVQRCEAASAAIKPSCRAVASGSCTAPQTEHATRTRTTARQRGVAHSRLECPRRTGHTRSCGVRHIVACVTLARNARAEHGVLCRRTQWRDDVDINQSTANQCAAHQDPNCHVACCQHLHVGCDDPRDWVMSCIHQHA